MIVFPHCKINLGLKVLRKRADGFHDLNTVFYPLFGLTDALEILPAEQVSLSVAGQSIPGDQDTNLCLKAHALLSADFPQLRPVRIYLHKHIPIGAGLGGGSSDGAFALRLLNRLFRLGLSREQLSPYAAALGSDCPFFLFDEPCRAEGKGDILFPIKLDLSSFRLLLVNPGIHVNTGWAFGQLEVRSHENDTDASNVPVSEWKHTLRNEFEPVVFNAHPEIAQIKELLYAEGATYAAMSGSGSTVFGLFPKENLYQPAFPPHYWVRQV